MCALIMSSSKRLGHKRPKAPKSQSMAKASELKVGDIICEAAGYANYVIDGLHFLVDFAKHIVTENYFQPPTTSEPIIPSAVFSWK